MDRTRILINADIRTPRSASPGTDAVAWVGDRIAAVGGTRDLTARWPDSEVVDVGGRTVTPGFIDAHLHPLPMAFFGSSVDLSSCRRLDEVLDLLRERARQIDDNEWVFAQQLDDELLQERRLPSRFELDAVSSGHPVVILRRDGHHAIGSSAALSAAGIDRATPDPPGGRIHRDAAGEPTGLCGESASSMLLDAVPVPSWDRLTAGLDQAVAQLAAHGVTGISAICQTDGEGPAGLAGELEAMAWSVLIERVPFDVQTILIGTRATERVADLRSGALHDPQMGRRIDAVKLFLDGTLGGHTACMHRPFSDHSSSGMLTKDLESAYAWMVEAHLAGLQICVHAIGDRANTEAVTLFRRLGNEHPGGHRPHRIEHASVCDQATIDLMAELGLAAVVQPISIRTEQTWLAKRLGDRIGSVYPYRAMLDAGVTVAGSSDAPIESTDVMASMQCAVERLGISPEQALTPTEALTIYTEGSSSVRGTGDVTGRLAEGMIADLVVLASEPGRESTPDVHLTVARGKVVHTDGLLPLPPTWTTGIPEIPSLGTAP